VRSEKAAADGPNVFQSSLYLEQNFDDLSLRLSNRRDELLESYSCILDREDEQVKRLADIAGAYAKFNQDSYIVFNATLETLKQSLDQLEKNAASSPSTSFPGDEGQGDGAADKTEPSKAPKSSYNGGARGGSLSAGLAYRAPRASSRAAAAAAASGHGDSGRINGALYTGQGMTGMIEV